MNHALHLNADQRMLFEQINDSAKFATGMVVFLLCWAYAGYSYGWLFGLGLGWLPAGFFGGLAASVWPLAWPVIAAAGIVFLQ